MKNDKEKIAALIKLAFAGVYGDEPYTRADAAMKFPPGTVGRFTRSGAVGIGSYPTLVAGLPDLRDWIKLGGPKNESVVLTPVGAEAYKTLKASENAEKVTATTTAPPEAGNQQQVKKPRSSPPAAAASKPLPPSVYQNLIKLARDAKKFRLLIDTIAHVEDYIAGHRMSVSDFLRGCEGG